MKTQKNIIYLGGIAMILSMSILACGNKKTTVSSKEGGNSSTANAKDWYGWEEGLKKAVAEDKFILVDVYTDWCGWCKKMDRNTYAKDTVKKTIAKHAVAIKINPELTKTYVLEGKTYTGVELLKFLASGKNDRGYPRTYFWLDPEMGKEGKRKYVKMGYFGPGEMLAQVEKFASLRKDD